MGVRLPSKAEIENHRKALEKEERRRIEREAEKMSPPKLAIEVNSDVTKDQQAVPAELEQDSTIDQVAQPKVLNNFKPKKR